MEREVHAKARVCNAALTADQSIKTTGKSKERRKPLCFPRAFANCPGYRKFQRLCCWYSAEHTLPRSQRPEGAEREAVLKEVGNWTVAHAWRLSLAIPLHCPRRQAYAAPTVPITPSLISSRPCSFPVSAPPRFPGDAIFTMLLLQTLSNGSYSPYRWQCPHAWGLSIYIILCYTVGNRYMVRSAVQCN